MRRLFAAAWLVASGGLVLVLLAALGSPPAAVEPSTAFPPPPVAGAKFHPAGATPATPSPACGGCHPIFPHAGRGSGPVFLNSHLALLDCPVCHLDGGAPRRGADGRLSLADAPIPGTGHRLPAPWRFLPRRSDACRSCHGASAPFPYAAYGYAEERRTEMLSLPHADIVDQGSPWVIPVF